MNRDLSKLLVVSDIDGTLLRAGYPVPERNLEMIRRFTEAGGNFSVCTGRGVLAVRNIVKEFGINSPAILCNGGIVYDFRTESFLSRKMLDPTWKELVLDILGEFPDIGFDIICGNEIIMVQNSRVIDDHIHSFGLEYRMAPLHMLSDKADKILFGDDEDTISRLKMYYNNKKAVVPYYRRFDAIATSPVYFEVIPPGVTKGTGLCELAKILGIRMKNTSAIGDFENDVPMFKAAGTAVAVGNAPDSVKSYADVVVCDCMCGGVGEYLEQLMNQ